MSSVAVQSTRRNHIQQALAICTPPIRNHTVIQTYNYTSADLLQVQIFSLEMPHHQAQPTKPQCSVGHTGPTDAQLRIEDRAIAQARIKYARRSHYHALPNTDGQQDDSRPHCSRAKNRAQQGRIIASEIVTTTTRLLCTEGWGTFGPGKCTSMPRKPIVQPVSSATVCVDHAELGQGRVNHRNLYPDDIVVISRDRIYVLLDLGRAELVRQIVKASTAPSSSSSCATLCASCSSLIIRRPLLRVDIVLVVFWWWQGCR